MICRLVVGEGAYNLARQYGLASEHSLVTPESLLRHERHKKYALGPDTCRNDTVGALVIDGYGDSAVGASSGGISLKLEGRIGHAALPGCGIWVEQGSLSKVCCCTSGTIFKLYS